MTVRKATHAGSWYSSSSSKLDKELDTWLEAVYAPSPSALDETDQITAYPVEGTKAIIAPHAGYSYSGPPAAWAYKCIDSKTVKRVFILGPSHHAYLDGCATTGCTAYATPIGDLPVDIETVQELVGSGEFTTMSRNVDEAEHSIEMHLPYVRKIFQDQAIRIVPILVGSISTSSEARFGSLLAPYLQDPETIFVVSSDFCHWGTRFRYTYYQPPDGSEAFNLSRSTPPATEYPIYKSITAVDKEGMSHIALDPSNTSKDAANAHANFASYLKSTKNTICGRHPIGVLLGAVAALQKAGTPGWDNQQVEIKWTCYEQSSECMDLSDSSVSYASAYLKAGPY